MNSPTCSPPGSAVCRHPGAGSQHVAVSDLANGGVRANGAADGEAAFHQQWRDGGCSITLSARQSNRAPPPTSPLATYLRSELLEVAGGEVEARLADQVVSSARNRLLSHYGDEESFFAPKKKSKKKRRTDAHGASEQAGELPSERRSEAACYASTLHAGCAPRTSLAPWMINSLCIDAPVTRLRVASAFVDCAMPAT